MKSANIATLCVYLYWENLFWHVELVSLYKKHSHVPYCMAVFIDAVHLYSVSLKLPSIRNGCYNDAVCNLLVYCISF